MRTTANNRSDELAALHAHLVRLRETMSSDGRQNLQVLIASDKIGVEDQVQILHDQFVALTRHDTFRQTLGLVTAALARFEAGEYGICVECEREIPLKRLTAVPWAALCVPCQERFENQPHGEEGDLLLTA